jgi:hypothetical protein
MKIHPAGTELFQANMWADRWTDTVMLALTFHNFANTIKKYDAYMTCGNSSITLLYTKQHDTLDNFTSAGYTGKPVQYNAMQLWQVHPPLPNLLNAQNSL